VPHRAEADRPYRARRAGGRSVDRRPVVRPAQPGAPVRGAAGGDRAPGGRGAARRRPPRACQHDRRSNQGRPVPGQDAGVASTDGRRAAARRELAARVPPLRRRRGRSVVEKEQRDRLGASHMSRILTVDDSRAIRAIVAKQVAEMGHELAEAEDGEQGLQRLAEGRDDLVLLDVTMPVLDGPGMLRRMRDRGDRTPVLMLTSESKRAIIAECMRLGIEDYILKPCKPEELHAKIAKILPGGAGAQPGPAAAAAAPEPGAGKAAVDFLLVDDMENVAKKLRSLLPAHVTLDTATGGPAALQMCRERTYR